MVSRLSNWPSIPHFNPGWNAYCTSSLAFPCWKIICSSKYGSKWDEAASHSDAPSLDRRNLNGKLSCEDKMLSVKRPGGNFLVGNEQISIRPSGLWFRLKLIYGFYFTEEQQEGLVMVRVEIQDVTRPPSDCPLLHCAVLVQRDPSH